jgi:hypothetical protein
MEEIFYAVDGRPKYREVWRGYREDLYVHVDIWVRQGTLMLYRVLYLLSNSHFDSQVKCQVEMFILVRKEAYCEALAKYLGLIWFESLLKGEENIQWRLARNESKMYRLVRTGIIKKMMNAASAPPHQNQRGSSLQHLRKELFTQKMIKMNCTAFRAKQITVFLLKIILWPM